MLFNNADECYNCIPPFLAEIVLYRKGCPKNIARTHTIVQKVLQFSPTISVLMMSGLVMSLQGPMRGVGQGGGRRPITWLALLLMLIQAYKMTNDGIIIKNSITSQEIKILDN